MTTNPQYAPRTTTGAAVERRLQVLVVGHELRVEALEMLLGQQQDLRVLTALVDAISPIDTVLSLIERRRTSRPIDVVLVDWDGDVSVNMPLLTALAKARQRSLVVTSLMLPSDMETLQKVGAWGYVLTTASSRHLYTAIGHVAQGRKTFPPVQLGSLPNPRIKRHLVFYPEILKVYAEDVVEVELTPIAMQILAHLAESNAVEIGARIDRQQGTIRTELSTKVFPFLRQLAKKYQLPISNVTNQKEAFEVAQMVGIFVYQ